MSISRVSDLAFAIDAEIPGESLKVLVLETLYEEETSVVLDEGQVPDIWILTV